MADDGQLMNIDERGDAIAEPTDDVGEVKDLLAHLREEGCNTLAPKTYVEGNHERQMIVRLLQFDPNRDFYTTKQGKNAPHKKALNQIASAMGVRWEDTERLDDMKDPNFAAVKAVCTIPDPATGKRRKHIAQYALDLREGSERADNMSQGQLDQKRRHIAALADTGAKLRAIREATGVRMDYTDQEAAQYFAIVSTIDRSNDQAAQLEAAEEASESVYGDAGKLEPGSPAPDPEEADPDFEDPDVIDVGGGDLPAREEFPDPVDWKAMPADQRDQWLEDAVAFADDFDAAGKLQGTQYQGTDLNDLPHSWQERLYERVFSDHIDTPDDGGDVEPPPF